MRLIRIIKADQMPLYSGYENIKEGDIFVFDKFDDTNRGAVWTVEEHFFTPDEFEFLTVDDYICL